MVQLKDCRSCAEVLVCGAILIAATALTVAADNNCWVDNTGDACDHYQDLDDCEDVPLGGGTCGNPQPAKEGMSKTETTNPDCVIAIKIRGSDGQCHNAGIFVVGVSCTQSAGTTCGTVK